MIVEPTVLILGAGASAPYDFPSGPGLLRRICEHLRDQDSRISREMVSSGHDRKALGEFRVELERSMQPSVDAFLEKRPEFTEIGKASMSCALIPFEQENTILKLGEERHWYKYLWNKMDAGLERFRENQLSVITFNYDRSIEHFLFVALKHSHGQSDEKTADLLRAIPIVHVYGQLGQYPPLAGEGRPYDPTITPEIVAECVSGIRIVHEAEDEAAFVVAHKLLTGASRICFLGFGYHENNLRRLRFDKLKKGKAVFGSAMGLKEAERHHVRELVRAIYDGPKLGNENQDALLMLREHPVLL